MKDTGTILAILNRRVREAGSQQQAAKDMGISGAYLCDVLKQRRAISDKLAAAMGYERIVRFRPLRKVPSNQ